MKGKGERRLDYLEGFIKPELMALVPVLYAAGIGLKKAQWVQDNRIPLLLGALGVVLALVYVLAGCELCTWKTVLMAVFTGVTQGILCAGASVYINQLVKQKEK